MLLKYFFLFLVAFAFSACGTSPRYQQTQLPDLDGCKVRPAYRKVASLSRTFFKIIDPLDDQIAIIPGLDKIEGYTKALSLAEVALGQCAACSSYEKANIYQRLAFINYHLENYDQAIDSFKKALSYSPYVPVIFEESVMYTLAQLLSMQKHEDEAEQYFDRWEGFCPATVPAQYYSRRAMIYYSRKEFDKAEANFKKYISVATDGRESTLFTTANKALGLIELQRGNIQVGNKYFTIAANRLNRTLPLEVLQPPYPPQALKKRIGGYCIVNFDISDLGSVSNVSVHKCTDKLFESASIGTAKQLKYRPKIEGGAAVEVPGQSFIFVFNVLKDQSDKELMLDGGE